MNQTNLLQKLAPVGVAAFSVISVIGIATFPVQAATFEGNLGFSDNTSDFYRDPSGFALNEIFSVTFNPTGFANNNISTGAFEPIFTPFDSYAADTVTADFQITSIPGDINGIFYEAELINSDLVFNFPGPNDNASTAGLTLEQGAIFEAEYVLLVGGQPGGLEFELKQDQGSVLVLDGESQPVNGIAFEFEDLPDAVGGEYIADAFTTDQIPEPTTILGLLTIGGLGLGLKHKKQA